MIYQMAPQYFVLGSKIYAEYQQMMPNLERHLNQYMGSTVLNEGDLEAFKNQMAKVVEKEMKGTKLKGKITTFFFMKYDDTSAISFKHGCEDVGFVYLKGVRTNWRERI